MIYDLSKHIESSTDMLEGGGEGVWATPPYLIAKQERIVEKGQSDPADRQILIGRFRPQCSQQDRRRTHLRCRAGNNENRNRSRLEHLKTTGRN